MRMKRAVPVLVAALLFGLSPVALGGPGNDKPSQKAPQPKPAPNPPPSNLTDHGLMTSMQVSQSGEILEISIDLPASNTSKRIDGCGAKVADHPLLLWAFQSRRMVRFTTETSTSCIQNYIVTAPTS